MFLIFDTETTGLPKNFKAPISDTDNWPRCVQIAWQLHAADGTLIEHKDFIIKPEGYDIPFQSEQIHGISTELAKEKGVALKRSLKEFKEALDKTEFVVGHNISFDINVIGCEFYRLGMEHQMLKMKVLDTCTEKTAQLCKILGGRGGRYKLPTLTELHQQLFDQSFVDAHNATADVEATALCFIELICTRSFSQNDIFLDNQAYASFFEKNKDEVQKAGIKHINLRAESKKLKKKKESTKSKPSNDLKEDLSVLKDIPFSHLHNHSQFSVLQSTIQVKNLIARAVKMGMPAVALTDIGNMMAAFHFIEEGNRHNKKIEAEIVKFEDAEVSEGLTQKIEALKSQKILPIIGSEFFVCHNRADKSYKDNGYLVPMIAKNKNGYHNLVRLTSSGYVEGFYYVPRIDKDILLKYKSDIIVTTGGLNGELSQLILNVGEREAEEAFCWWHEQFGEDFYVELTRHGLEEEEKVNEVMLGFAKKYGVKYFAANNTHYLYKEDSVAHDILLCIKDNQQRSTPIGKGRGFRYGFPNDEFYFKSQDEMKSLFADLPDSIMVTNEIVAKCEPFQLTADVLLPEFKIPEDFNDGTLEDRENNYLRHLTYKGAEKRYKEITAELSERIDFELKVIKNTGYPGYFLIVQDFCQAARDMDVSVGPGRGSAAGSIVAYCTGITNVDPIKYNLLFERFLNPDRISMPDIDIDFDDEGRGRVIQYVIDKYGSSQVAQIITYGSMAAKSSIRDTGRVLDLPLPETDRLAKLVPDMKLNELLDASKESLLKRLSPEQMKMADELKNIYSEDNIQGEVIKQAKLIEGSMRNTGIHACGVIITPSDIRNYVPVALAKDTEMWCTQFDNSVAENAGLLKMDFLGLKTLTLIKDTVKIIKAISSEEIDIDQIPLDDEKTYELFQRGETIGIFQYESAGMQKHLKSLRPTEFSDLIAMNALYRPGPIEYIPSFIKRKHGNEEIVYDLPVMEKYLKETYGITVYQEQVMLLSQILAGFTKGEADTLRKAMGKKKIDLLEKLKPKFLDQGKERGHDKVILEKIWKDWEAFASYAFNKSHSTCYALIAYQTAYLKANYPAEYMASVLSNNMNDIKSVTFFMKECNRMEMKVLGPDVNESWYKFAVNKKGEIRFGLGAIKGVGKAPVNNIVEMRKTEGVYFSIFDFIKRVNIKDCNKRVLESLAMAGAFDSFQSVHRAQYFQTDEKGRTLIEKVLKFGHSYQIAINSPQISLFGENSDQIQKYEPIIPDVEEWTTFEKLNKEKEVVGIYISGHPLQDYQLELNNFCDINLKILNDNIDELPERDFSFVGIANNALNLESRKGKKYGVLEIQDMEGTKEFRLFGEQYLKFMHFFVPGNFLFIKGKVQDKPKYYKSDGSHREFRIKHIDLLNDVREKLINSVYLRWDSNIINDKEVNKIDQLFTKYKGNKPVYFELVDREEISSVVLSSRKANVSISNDFFDELRSLDSFLGYSVNKSKLDSYIKKLVSNSINIEKELIDDSITI